MRIEAQTAFETFLNCRYCLMCRHLSPLEVVTKREALSPHGLALLAVSVERGLIEWTPEVVEKIYAEADDGVARAHCVTNQPHGEAFAILRAALAQENLAPAAVYRVNEGLLAHGNPYGQTAPGPAGGMAEDVLYVGDDAHFLRPAAAEAARRLLQAAAVHARPVGVGRSSGLLAHTLGFPSTAEKLAQAVLDEVLTMGARRVFVLTPGDAYALTQGMVERLGMEWPQGIEVVEVTAFLAAALADGRVAFRQVSPGMPYAYVDPTHAVRVPGRHDAPRALLRAALGDAPLELFWRRDRAHPAGTTGVRFARPDIAAALTRARMIDAARTGAKLLITEDPATFDALGNFSGEFGLRVGSLYELLAAQLA